MAAYGIGLLHDVDLGPAIVEYLERIDETLAPYGGRFIVHGGEQTRLEGESDAVIVIIEFPDRAATDGWYRSDAYQAILALRAEHSRSEVWILDGMEVGHIATDVLPAALLDAAPRG